MLSGCSLLTGDDEVKLGNTSSNIAAFGKMAEDSEWIYFSNPRDEDRLYRMRKDHSQLSKLSDKGSIFINLWEDYIIFIDSKSGEIIRIHQDGTKEEVILSEEAFLYGGMVVANDDLYYSLLSDRKLYRMSLKNGSTDLISDHTIAYLNANETGLVYLDQVNQFSFDLVSMTFESLKPDVIGSTELTYPIIEKDWIYFSRGQDWDLYRIKFQEKSEEKTKSLEKVGDLRAIKLSFYKEHAYYLNLSDSKVYKADLDFSDSVMISEDIFEFLIANDKIYSFRNSPWELPFSMSLDGQNKELFLTYPLIEEISSQANDPLRFGNTPLNQRKGILVADDTYIYTAFAKSANQLVRMLPDGSQSKVMVDSSVFGLNLWGDWIYYVNQSNFLAIERVNLNDSRREVVADVGAEKMAIVGNWIYYMKANDSKLHRIRVDGREESLISDIQISDFQIWIVDDVVQLAVTSLDTGYLLYMDENGLNQKTLIKERVHTFTYNQGWVFYIIYPEAADPELRKFSIKQTEDQLIKNVLVEDIGVYEGDLYYSINGEIIKKSIKYDLDWRLTPRGFYGNFSIAFGYLYFQNFQAEDSGMFRVKLNGSELAKLKDD